MASELEKELDRFQFHGTCCGMKGLIGVALAEDKITIYFDKADDAYGDYTFKGDRIEITTNPFKLILFRGEEEVADVKIEGS